jgi:hypothetical protein
MLNYFASKQRHHQITKEKKQCSIQDLLCEFLSYWMNHVTLVHYHIIQEIKIQNCKQLVKFYKNRNFVKIYPLIALRTPIWTLWTAYVKLRVRIFERGGGGPPSFGVRLGQVDHPRWVRFPWGFERQCVCGFLDIIYVAVYIYNIYYTAH